MPIEHLSYLGVYDVYQWADFDFNCVIINWFQILLLCYKLWLCVKKCE